jgi:hypothetical protein
MSSFIHFLLLGLRTPLLSPFCSDSWALLLSLFYAIYLPRNETNRIWKPARILKRIQTRKNKAKKGVTLQCIGSLAKAGF